MQILENPTFSFNKLPPPPSEFKTTNQNVDYNKIEINEFKPKALNFLEQTFSEFKTTEDKYSFFRQYMITYFRSSSIKEYEQEELKKIKNILENGTHDEVVSLYKQRHIWRQKIHEYRGDDCNVCAIEDCIYTALPGSDYCVCHILNDKNQKLFSECPDCRKPYPIYCKCYSCDSKNTQE